MRNLDLKPGDKFAHFVIVRLLGQGGMGRVFEAEHEFTHRRTALKLILEHLVDHDMRERMIQEARALAELDHPNIVRLYDANMTDGTIWLAMEFLQGKTLRAYRNTVGPVPVPQALHLLIETCDGVAAAHEIGIVHRDLKPENILLTEQNVTKVLDFGAAKLVRGEKGRTTAIGPGGKRRIIGTPEYMSPEHLRGDRVDDRTDSYALAVIGMELLWDHPFRNPDGAMPEVYELVRRQFIEPPPHLRDVAPHVPREIADILDRGLAKQAAERPSTAEMAAAFRAARTSFKAANPDADSAPFAKQWTGAGAWAVHGPAVSLPRHVPAPKEPSRSVVVQVPGSPAGSDSVAPATPRMGAASRTAAQPATSVPTGPSSAGAMSVAPESPPVFAGDAPRSHATPVYAKTQELAPSGSATVPPAARSVPTGPATLDLRPQRAPTPPAEQKSGSGDLLTAMPVTVGPEQRGSQPAQTRARRTRMLVLFAACCAAGVAAGVFALRGIGQPAAAITTGTAASETSATSSAIPAIPAATTIGQTELPAATPPEPTGSGTPTVTPTIAPGSSGVAGSKTKPTPPKGAPGRSPQGGPLDLPFADGPPPPK